MVETAASNRRPAYVGSVTMPWKRRSIPQADLERSPFNIIFAVPDYVRSRPDSHRKLAQLGCLGGNGGGVPPQLLIRGAFWHSLPLWAGFTLPELAANDLMSCSLHWTSTYS